MKIPKPPLLLGFGGLFFLFVFFLMPIGLKETVVVTYKVTYDTTTNFYSMAIGEVSANGQCLWLFIGLLISAMFTVIGVWRKSFWASHIFLYIFSIISLYILLWPMYHDRNIVEGTGVRPYWYGWSGPGFLHWIVLGIGFNLFRLAVFQIEAPAKQRTTIELRGPTKQPTRTVARTSRRQTISFGDFLESIDWGWWGIALLALAVWPLGLLLYFAYSRTGDDKGGAALIGAALGLGLMVLRFVMAMAKVGGAG